MNINMKIILQSFIIIIGCLIIFLIIVGLYSLLYGQEQAKENFCTETYGEEYKYHYPGQTPYRLEACVKVNANSSLDIKYIPKEQNE